MSREETIQDLEAILAGDDDEPIVNDKNTEGEDEPEVVLEENPDDKENLEQDSENDDKDNEDDKDDKDDKEDLEKLEGVQFKAITKKYPTLFKDFPNLRHVFFHEKEYRELFPTVDEAKEAVEELDGYRQLADFLSNGDLNSTESVIEAFGTLGDNVITDFATNFLPALEKVDRDLYFQTVTPVMVNSVRAMYSNGVKHENENLQNAAMVIALHLFGDMKIATGEKELKLGTQTKDDNKKDNKLEQERSDFKRQVYTSFFNNVQQDANTQLKDLIMEGIDPKNNLTSGMKGLIAKEVAEEITKVLGSSKVHKSRMDSLWKKASESNFGNSHKSRIVSAYLEAAGAIMPRIRSKVKANVLNIRERQPVRKGGSDRREPKNNSGGGGTRSSNGKPNSNPSAKEIDWKKTSDLDLFNDKFVLKK